MSKPFSPSSAQGSEISSRCNAVSNSEGNLERRIRLVLPKDSGLKAGEVVEIFNKDRTPEAVRIKSTEGTGITVALRSVEDGEEVFVYGHQVNDFRTLDYDAISMLNVSATQELAKKSAAQDVRIAEQNARIKVLEAENAKLAAIVSKWIVWKKPSILYRQRPLNG